MKERILADWAVSCCKYILFGGRFGKSMKAEIAEANGIDDGEVRKSFAAIVRREWRGCLLQCIFFVAIIVAMHLLLAALFSFCLER